MEIISIIISVMSAAFSFITYIKTVRHQKRKATIEAFNSLQNEVLDNFVCIKEDNARIIIENLDNEECKIAYNDQRALIARLEHFAVGVSEKIYDFNVVDKLAGRHLVYLYKKIEPIINEANKHEQQIVHYQHFVKLVEDLNGKYNILGKECN